MRTPSCGILSLCPCSYPHPEHSHIPAWTLTHEHIHMHIYACTLTHAHARLHITLTHAHIHRQTYTCTLTNAHAHLHMHMYTYTCTCTHAHLHIHLHTYTYTGKLTHEHVHMHTYTCRPDTRVLRGSFSLSLFPLRTSRSQTTSHLLVNICLGYKSSSQEAKPELVPSGQLFCVWPVSL